MILAEGLSDRSQAELTFGMVLRDLTADASPRKAAVPFAVPLAWLSPTAQPGFCAKRKSGGRAAVARLFLQEFGYVTENIDEHRLRQHPRIGVVA